MRLLALVALLSASPGCLLLRHGTIQDIHFDSDPPGAAVSFHGKEGVTPCDLKIPRSRQPREVVFTLGKEELRQEVASDDTIRDPGDFFLIFLDTLLILPVIIDLVAAVGEDYPARMTADFEKRTIQVERPRWEQQQGALVPPGYWDAE